MTWRSCAPAFHPGFKSRPLAVFVIWMPSSRCVTWARHAVAPPPPRRCWTNIAVARLRKRRDKLMLRVPPPSARAVIKLYGNPPPHPSEHDSRGQNQVPVHEGMIGDGDLTARPDRRREALPDREPSQHQPGGDEDLVQPFVYAVWPPGVVA